MSRVANVREIEGKASGVLIGELVAFKYRTGKLGRVWRRVEGDPEFPGSLQFQCVSEEDGEYQLLLPEDLGRHVRVEAVETEAVPS